MPAAPDLHVHSTFSMLDGMGTPEDVVKQAKALGWGSVALTEHGHVMSAPALYQAARANGLNPIIGCELYVVSNEILGVKSKDTRSASHHLTVLALSAEGYHNLVAWTSFASRPDNFYYTPRISLDAMAEEAPYPLRHNVVLSGCMGSELCACLPASNPHPNIEIPLAYIYAMKSLFPNFYIEVQNHERRKLMDKGYGAWEDMVAREAVVRGRLLTCARQTGTKVILTNDSHFQAVEQRTSHLMMTASKRGGKDWAHNYLPQYGYFTNYMQPMERIAEHTSDLPSDTLENALEISAEASVKLEPLDTFSYSFPPSGYADPN